MNTTLDINNTQKLKSVNLFAILISFALFIALLIRVKYTLSLIENPLIPKYLVVYANAAGINIMCFVMAGMIPAIILRIKNQYLYSTICLLLFFAVGVLFKDNKEIYESFYWMSNYL